MLENDNCNIYGIISSNHRDTETKPYQKKLQEHFQDNGGIVYIFSKDDREQFPEYLDKLLEINLKDSNKKNRIVFIYREDFLIGDTIDLKALGEAIKTGLLKLEESSANKKYIYITINSFWNDFLGEDGEICYDFLRGFNRRGDTKVVLRYIMEELSEKYIYNLLKYHNLLLVDGVEDFEVYTPEELMYRSITLLSRHNLLIYNFDKEMIRLEYLKTLGELMEGTVHDMNNLLITILGYAQLAMLTEDKKNAEESLKIIQKTALDGKIIVDRLQII